MRARFLRFAAVALLAGSAFAVGAPSHASPASCAGSCTVKADTNTGYVSPVIEVASGADVTWLASTTSHPTFERSAAPCFHVDVAPNVATNPVVFTSSATGVTATIGTTTLPCPGAVQVGDAAWVVPYHCQLHPWMNGTIVVDR